MRIKEVLFSSRFRAVSFSLLLPYHAYVLDLRESCKKLDLLLLASSERIFLSGTIAHFFLRAFPLPVLDFPPILESFLIELRLEHARLGAGDRWITY